MVSLGGGDRFICTYACEHSVMFRGVLLTLGFSSSLSLSPPPLSPTPPPPRVCLQTDPAIKEAQSKSFLKAQGKGRGLVRLWLTAGDLAARVETASKDVRQTKDCYTPSALLRSEDAVDELVASLRKLEKTRFSLHPFLKGLDDAWPCVASVDAEAVPAASSAVTTAGGTLSDTHNAAAVHNGAGLRDDGLAVVDLSDETATDETDLGTSEVSGTGASKRSPTELPIRDAEPAEITIAELENALEGALQKCMLTTASHKKIREELQLANKQSEERIASLQEATESANVEAEDAKYNLLLIKAEQKAMERLLDQMDSGEVSKAVEAEVLTVKYV